MTPLKRMLVVVTLVGALLSTAPQASAGIFDVIDIPRGDKQCIRINGLFGAPQFCISFL